MEGARLREASVPTPRQLLGEARTRCSTSAAARLVRATPTMARAQHAGDAAGSPQPGCAPVLPAQPRRVVVQGQLDGQLPRLDLDSEPQGDDQRLRPRQLVVVAGGVLPPPTPPAGAKNYVDTSRPPPAPGFQRWRPRVPAEDTASPARARRSAAAAAAAAAAISRDERGRPAKGGARASAAAACGPWKTLPDEPEKVQIAVRLPDGTRAVQFPTDALLQSLVDFVALQLAEKGIVGERW